MSTDKLSFRIKERPQYAAFSIRLDPDQREKLVELCDIMTEREGRLIAQGKLIGALIDRQYEIEKQTK